MGSAVKVVDTTAAGGDENSRDARWEKLCKQIEWAGLRHSTTREVFDQLFPDATTPEGTGI